MGIEKEVITAIAIGIGLSASVGFRVFIPLLVASIAARAGIFPVQESFQWLASLPAIIAFATAAIVEITAYYIPFIDNLLDSITTPLAFGAGTLLMTSILPIDSELLKWTLGIISGGGIATTIQSGSVLARLTSSKFTAGLGNPVVATGEQVAAVGTSVLALFIPFIIAILSLLLAVFLLYKLSKLIFR